MASTSVSAFASGLQLPYVEYQLNTLLYNKEDTNDSASEPSYAPDILWETHSNFLLDYFRLQGVHVLYMFQCPEDQNGNKSVFFIYILCGLFIHVHVSLALGKS